MQSAAVPLASEMSVSEQADFRGSPSGGAEPPVISGAVGSRRRAISNPWAILSVLVLLHVIWSLDRAVPSIVAEQVKTDFALSDAQLGLFTGLAYGVAYGLGGIVAGLLIDRFNRTRLLAMMIAVWSGLTAVCGFAHSYLLLLASRVGIGAAESGASPASYSVISDIFPIHRRATAIGIFKVGSPVGILVATIACGYIAAEHGWRMAFLVAGLPGLVLAFVVWRWVPEPRRGEQDDSSTPVDARSLREVGAMIKDTPGVAWLMLGVILFMFANAGPTAFLMPYLQRVHDVSLITASQYYAAASGVGAVGPLLAGVLSDRLAKRGLERTMYFAALICLATFAAGLVMVLADSFAAVIAGLFVWQLLAVSLSAPNFATLLSLTPPETRGTVTALLMVGMYLLGLGPSPYAAGLLSDFLGGGAMLRYSLAAQLSVNLLCCVTFVLSATMIKRSSLRAPA